MIKIFLTLSFIVAQLTGGTPLWSDNPLADSWEIITISINDEGRCYVELKLSEQEMEPGTIIIPGHSVPLRYEYFIDEPHFCGYRSPYTDTSINLLLLNFGK